MKTLFLSTLLAFRRLQRSNPWTTLLIIVVMTITFINLIAVKAILTGIVEGSRQEQRIHYTGDVIVKPDPAYVYIRESNAILNKIQGMDVVKAYSARYIGGGTLQGDYKKNRKESELLDEVGTTLVGINPLHEQAVTGLGDLMIEGEFLEPDDFDMVVLGADLLERYSVGADSEESALREAEVGQKLRLIVGDKQKEVTIKGILDAKSGAVAQRAYFTESYLRQIIGRNDLNRGEIAITLQDNVRPITIRRALEQTKSGRLNKVETWIEAQGAFLTDISDTFGALGDIVGSIGLFIAACTIFIIIFINAVNAQKYIGIMKAIGINRATITLSYIMQSFFYAFIGVGLGLWFILGYLEPYFIANPLDFPFSDGILAITATDLTSRTIILLGITMLAGFIPARMIVSKNTIDSILQR